jgi:hypothetical protein
MVNFKSTEELLAWIVDYFAEHFGAHAILKGGMALKLLHSPRYTNDVDYVFVPFGSKLDIEALIHAKLSKVNGLDSKATFNSKAMRLLVRYGGQSAQIEINVSTECPSTVASTALLGGQYGYTPKVVRIMDLPVSCAHKLAAWNERRLLRDLYDIYQFISVLDVFPDHATLIQRLAETRAYHGIKPAKNLGHLKNDLLKEGRRAAKDSLNELKPLLAPEELIGLGIRLQGALGVLVKRLGDK